MKNLSVGKKILTGFLAVILMIAIILGLTIVTSLTRNRDLETVNTMSDLRRESNTMLQEFLLARVEIRTLFDSLNADEEYALAKEYLASSQNHLAQMQELSTQLDGYMSADLADLELMFADVHTGIDGVHEMDGQANEALAAMVENGTMMTNSAASLFDLVLNVTRQMGAEDPNTTMDRMDNAVVPAKNIGDIVDGVRIASRTVMYTQDLTVIPDLLAQLDDLNSSLASMRATLLTEEARAAVDSVSAAAEGFRSSLQNVETILTQQVSVIDAARVTFLDLYELVDKDVAEIATAVTALNEQTIQTSMTVMFIMIAVGGIAVVFSIVVATVLGRMITRPLNKMKNVALQAGSTGNLEFSEEVRNDILKEAAAKDEIGQSLKEFAAFIDHVVAMGHALDQVARKDLTVDINLLSDEDTMGNALMTMVDTLNYMFSEINSISSQVATASNEVAMGAQSLAQGSTEQASTVQEISASVNEINEQMSTSNETARASAQQAEEINQIARVGNEKMNQLSGSMHEINEASQSIGNVIKVIDDIAFQTTILALNAAVEAARAGEHGKGFAVVADEVRSLADKSADAAKETAQLISTNIEKTEQGMTYTTETAESLNQIMEGIGKTNDSLQLVAEQAEGAKAATGQVTLAIDQVAQVVQQNSATSEQSAAASQEMNSQAQVLQQLISEFKLKDIPRDAPGLPTGRAAPEDMMDHDMHSDAGSIIF